MKVFYIVSNSGVPEQAFPIMEDAKMYLLTVCGLHGSYVEEITNPDLENYHDYEVDRCEITNEDLVKILNEGENV